MTSVQTQPQLEKGRESDVPITVHEYLSSAFQPRASQHNALREGYQIVKYATSRDPRWKPVKVVPTRAGFETKKSYIFNRTPPIIKAESVVLQGLKDWGAAVTEDEVYTLDDLDEFDTSTMRHIGAEDTSEERTPKESSSLSPETQEKRAMERSLSQEPERKKRKLRAGSLFRLIPQPHLHPSVPEVKPLTFSGIFKKPKPTFIAPYTMDTFPNNSRLGWLIPVRGSFPWENCTSGEILDNLEIYVPVESGTSNRISWSEDTVIKFWNYLLEIRKQGKLGRMAISFHSSRQPKQLAETSRLGLVSDASKATNPRESSCTFKFSTVDFFKVYHDARNALYVRKALDVFTYSYTNEDGRVEKIRMLKGARLALVDEVSQGVLVV